MGAQGFLKLLNEGDALDYSQQGWEPGDADFFAAFRDKKTSDQFAKDFDAALLRLPEARKMEVVEFIRRAVKAMEENRFTRKDFGDGFVFIWSDQELVEIVLGMIGKPRDEMTFDRFDEVVRQRNPAVVGIKFGAGHVAYQRELLERRGYVCQRLIELKNYAF